MKSVVTALALCFGLAVSTSAVQQTQQGQAQQAPQPPAAPQTPTMPELTLTGCLVQGSTPAVFIFENVRKDPKNAAERPVKYLVIAATEDLNLRAHLNHEVRILGTSDGRVAPPTNQKVEEKDLPKFSAKSLTMVSDTCSVPAR